MNHENDNTPAAYDIERALIGLALQHPVDVMDAITEGIGQGAFHHQSIKHVYVAMQEMVQAEKEIDPLTVAEWIRNRDKLDTDAYRALFADIQEWMEKGFALGMMAQYIDVLRDRKLRRDALRAAELIHVLANEPDKPAADIMNEAQAILFEVQANENRGLKPIKSHVKNVIEEIQHAYRNRGKVTKGLTTGFIELDRMFMGLKPGNLTYIAARPSMGKTTFALNIALHAAIECGIPVDIFSLEMTSDQLTQKIVCSHGGLSLQRVRDGFFDKSYNSKLLRSSQAIATSQIEIDETSQITIAELRARARRSKLKRNTGLIVVDYLQLMRGVSKQAQNSREREIAEISAGLKAMAKELMLPVIVLAQLNRSVDERRDKRPMLSDLRESGSIEQDADEIIFLTRPVRYMSDPDDIEANKHHALCIIGKNRNGPVGDFNLHFDGEYSVFKNPEHQEALYGKKSYN